MEDYEFTILPSMSMAYAERKAIINALVYTQWNRAEAAELLGIGRTTLYRKIKLYSIKTRRSNALP